MLKTGHLFFNTAALVMNRYKNRAETGLQNLDNRAILCKVRGIGAAGSAFASHVKGRGFESHMLHGKGLVNTRPFSFRVAFRVASFSRNRHQSYYRPLLALLKMCGCTLFS